MVVVPPEMMRLLKVVNFVDGRLLFAVSSTVPAPGVQTDPVPPTVIAPFTFK